MGQKGIFYTKCIYCGRRARKDARHLAKNKYGDSAYYCNKCMNEGAKVEVTLRCHHCGSVIHQTYHDVHKDECWCHECKSWELIKDCKRTAREWVDIRKERGDFLSYLEKEQPNPRSGQEWKEFWAYFEKERMLCPPVPAVFLEEAPPAPPPEKEDPLAPFYVYGKWAKGQGYQPYAWDPGFEVRFEEFAKVNVGRCDTCKYEGCKMCEVVMQGLALPEEDGTRATFIEAIDHLSKCYRIDMRRVGK